MPRTHQAHQDRLGTSIALLFCEQDYRFRKSFLRCRLCDKKQYLWRRRPCTPPPKWRASCPERGAIAIRRLWDPGPFAAHLSNGQAWAGVWAYLVPKPVCCAQLGAVAPTGTPLSGACVDWYVNWHPPPHFNGYVPGIPVSSAQCTSNCYIVASKSYKSYAGRIECLNTCSDRLACIWSGIARCVLR